MDRLSAPRGHGHAIPVAHLPAAAALQPTACYYPRPQAMPRQRPLRDQLALHRRVLGLYQTEAALAWPWPGARSDGQVSSVNSMSARTP